MPPPDVPLPAADDPLIGRTLGDAYRVVARLGSGAMGTVYRARHALLDQDFAVKVLAPALAADPDVRRRFLLEARSLAAFAHRNAVQVRHCGDDHGLLFLVMDLVPGETLAALLERERRLAPPRAVAIAIQILDALGEAHAAGLVHRDVKPGNVMVEGGSGPPGASRERVRVVDFGLARIVDVERAAMPSAFTSLGGHVVGTVAYMAPEQLRAEEVDERADLFGVGVVLYEMLAGGLPFPGTSTMSIALRIVERPFEPWPADALASLPSPLRAVVERALEKDPERRFQSAGQMADALRDALAGIAPPPMSPKASTVAPPAPPPSSVDRPAVGAAGAPAGGGASRRRRSRVALAAAVVLAGVAAVAVPRLLAPTPSDRARAARARGEDALSHARFAEAVDAFTDALAAAPGDVEALLGRAEARTALEDRNARPDLDEAARRRPDDVAVLVARARYLDRVEKDRKAAEEDLGRALFVDRTSVDARVERATERLAAGDLDAVELDVAAIERDARTDARGAALRARLLIARAHRPDARDGAALLARAVEAATDAAELDPRWAEGASVRAAALQEEAHAAKARGDYTAARARIAQMAVAANEAVDRATRFPAHRRQGASAKALLVARAGASFLQDDVPRALEDLDAAFALAPRDAGVLGMRAYARQQMGLHEQAIEDHERLYDITHEKDPLFRVGFGWQQIGAGHADDGDVPEALAAYDRAIATYTRALERFPGAADLRAYRGETYAHRARLRLPGEARESDLAAARADLDAVLAAAPSDSEALLRRAEAAVIARRYGEAVADARAAVGDHKDRTPRFYASLAQADLALARAEGTAGHVDVARAAVAEAIDAATRARDVSPDSAVYYLPIRAAAHVRAAALAVDAPAKAAALAAARADLAALREQAETSAADADARRRAVRAKATAALVTAEMLLVAGDPAGAVAAAREAVATREAERAAGRWSLDATWYERLADACAAAGDAAGERDARAQAAALPH